MKKILSSVLVLCLTFTQVCAQSVGPDQRAHQPANRTRLAQPLSPSQGGLGVSSTAFQTVISNSSAPLLPKWRAALAKVMSGTANATLYMIGDSTFAGTGATSTTNIAAALANALNQNGVNTTYSTGFPNSNMGDGTITPGSWSGGGWVFGGPDVYSAAATATPFSYATNKNVDTFKIFYAGNYTGSISYTIDGGSATTLTLPAGGTVMSTTVSGIGLKAHNISISWNTGTVVLYGIQAFDSTRKQVLVVDGGVPTSTSTQWAATNGSSGVLDTLNNFGQNLSVICLGINDWNSYGGVDPISGYTANMQAVINKARLVGDVVLVVPTPSQTGTGINGSVAYQYQYVQALYSLAASNNVPLVDFTARLGSWAIANSNGLMFDQYHPNAAGYSDEAQALLDVIKGVSSTGTPTLTGAYFTGLVGVDNTAPLYPLDVTGAERATQLVGGGSTPTIAAGAGAGTSPTVNITGTPLAGVVNVATGTSPASSSTLATVTYAAALSTAQQGCTVTPRNALTAAAAAMIYTTTPTTTAWTIAVGGTALTASTAYSWSYSCF